MATLAEAFISLRAEGSKLIVESRAMGSESGDQAGDAFAKEFSKEVIKASKGMFDVLGVAGQQAGADAGDKAANAFNERLARLNVAPIDLDADVSDALREIDRVEAELRELATNPPNATIRIDSVKALAEIERLKKSMAFEVKADVDTETLGAKIKSGLARAFVPDPAFGASLFEFVAHGISRSITAALSTPISVAAVSVIVASIGNGIIAGTVFLGAAITAAILGGLNIAVLAGGIALVADDPRVIAAGQRLKDRVIGPLKEAAKPLAPLIASALDRFALTATRVMPRIEEMFKAVLPTIGALANGIAKLAENSMPGLTQAVIASRPIIDALAAALPGLGDSISYFFSKLSSPEAVEGARLAMSDLIRLVGLLIRMSGELLASLSANWATLRPALVEMGAALREIGITGDMLRVVFGALGSMMMGSVYMAILSVTLSARTLNAVWDGIRLATQAVGAAMLWLWQTVMVPAWNGIKSAAQAAWNIIGAVFSGMNTGTQKSGDLTNWLWQNVMLPAWNAIRGAIAFAWSIISPILGALHAALQVVGNTMSWVVNTIFVPAWRTIASIVSFAWGIMQAIWSAQTLALQLLGNTMMWLWQAVFAVAWAAIRGIIGAAWVFIKSQWDLMFFYIHNVMAPTWRFFQSVAEAVWHAVSVAIQAASNFIRSILQAMINFIAGPLTTAWRVFDNFIGQTMSRVVSAVSAAWGFIRDVIFAPMIKWVTQTVPNAWVAMFNQINEWINRVRVSVLNALSAMVGGAKNLLNDFIGLLNKVVDAVNKIPPGLKIPHITPLAGGGPVGFAQGGAVYGPGNGTSDSVWARMFTPNKGPEYFKLSAGEHVVTANEVRQVGGQQGMYNIRSMIRSGAISGRASGVGDMPGFSIGGGVRPGMGRDMGMVPAINAVYRKYGGTGPMSSGYRPGDPLWHGSGLAADFSGFNQDAVASRLLASAASILELIHTTGRGGYYVTRGRRVTMTGPVVNEHRNHLHFAAEQVGLTEMMGGPIPIGASPGGGGGLLSWLLSPAGKLIKKLFDKALNAATNFLPKDASVASQAIKGVGMLPINALKSLFDSRSGGVVVGASGDVARDAYNQAKAMNASRKVMLALFEAGLVESGMRNLNFGDRDSLGFLQQRPSAGWGTPQQIMNVPYATASFVRRAQAIEGRYGNAGSLAQAVQISAFPQRYQQRRGEAVSIIRGFDPGYDPNGFKRGGAVQPSIGVFDKGGAWPDGMWGYNGSGKTEFVRTHDEETAVATLLINISNKLSELLGEAKKNTNAVENVGGQVGAEINSVGAQIKSTGRRR